jgi:hypothetical protein
MVVTRVACPINGLEIIKKSLNPRNTGHETLGDNISARLIVYGYGP